MPEFDSIDDYLAHHGVKGMKWGKRKAPDDSSGGDKKAAKTSRKAGKLDLKISKSDASLQERAKSLANLQDHISDLRQNGTKSTIFKAQFGEWPSADDTEFNRRFGKSKAQAIADFDEQLSSMRNSEAIALNLSSSRNKRLKNKRDKLSHDDLSEYDVDELGHVDETDTFEFLAHYGVEVEAEDLMSHYDTGVDLDDTLAHYGIKGMKWGKRKAADSAPSERQVKRAAYKSALKSARQKDKTGEDYSKEERKAVLTNMGRKAAVALAAYGALQVGGYVAGKAVGIAADRQASAAATRGAQFATRNMKALQNYPVIRLRQGGNGSWG